MLKKIGFQKVIAAFTVLSLCMCMNVSAFAAENTTAGNEPIEATDSISTKVISGSGECTTNGYQEFFIYSPAWSIWGHAQITVSGGTALVSIVSPNGNSAIASGGVLLSSGSHRVNLINTVAGNYSVHVQSSYGETVTVRVELKDF